MKMFTWLPMLSSVPLIVSAGSIGNPLDLDPAFGGDGALVIEIGVHDYGFDGMMDDSGDIVVFGYSDNGSPSNGEAIFQRIGINGVPDTPIRFDAAAFGCSVPRAFQTGLRLSNGDYIGGGYVQDGCSGVPRHFNALQLTATGILVDEFDRIVFNNQLAYISAMAEQSDGRIIAAGFASDSGFDGATYDIAVARYTSDGVLDATFGTNGLFTYDFDGNLDWTNDVVVDASDRIVLAGYARSAMDNQDIIILRLSADGVPDATFNGTGQFIYDRAGFSDSATSLALANQGRILVGAVTSPSDSTREANVFALTDSGVLDTGFSGDGQTTVSFGNGREAITDIQFKFGNIYVAGVTRTAGTDAVNNDAAVAVLYPDGSPHLGFNGGSGRVFIFDAELGAQADVPQSISVSNTGEQIAVIGYTDNEARTKQRIGVARFFGLNQNLFANGFEVD